MSIYKRKSGRYVVVIAMAVGSTQRRSLGTFATRKEAAKGEREALSLRDRGIDLAPAKVTVAELLTRYLRDRNTRCTPKTLQEYEKMASAYIIPRIGTVQLANLRPAHIAEWQHVLEERGGSKGRMLSAKTVSHARGLLSATLRWACKMQLLAVNPCASVDAPKVRRSAAKALSRQEMARLLVAANDTRWGPFVTLALTLGARRGELLALRWSSIDAENRTVTIDSSLSQTKAAGVMVKGTKTDRTRTVPLSSLAIEAIARQRAMPAADKLRAGGLYKGSDCVFADEFGGHLSPMAATNAYARLARKAQISSTRLHDLRHSTATTLLLSGVDVRTVASILGHSVATTTLTTYAHVMIDAQRDAIDRLGSELVEIARNAGRR